MSTRRTDELIDKILSNMPEALQHLPSDIKKSLKNHLDHTLNKMDIVTREEFDAQKAVLERTRQKLDALEVQLNQLSLSKRKGLDDDAQE